MVTTNLPFDEWTEVFGSERLTGALLDRLTHHIHILEMNGESYRLKRSRENAEAQALEKPEDAKHTTNAAPSYSCNVSTLTDLLRHSPGRLYTVTPPPVAQLLGAIDTSAQESRAAARRVTSSGPCLDS